MKVRELRLNDIPVYMADIYKCYKDNHLIFDNQSEFKDMDELNCKWFVQGFIEASDSIVMGVFDEKEEFLYGLIIFDNIRWGSNNSSCAEVHIVTDRCIWGNVIKSVYSDVLNSIPFTVLYCSIPSIAVFAIRMCKQLGFKKTGYIPKALPYLTNKGEEKMFDLQIWSYQR